MTTKNQRFSTLLFDIPLQCSVRFILSSCQQHMLTQTCNDLSVKIQEQILDIATRSCMLLSHSRMHVCFQTPKSEPSAPTELCLVMFTNHHAPLRCERCIVYLSCSVVPHSASPQYTFRILNLDYGIIAIRTIDTYIATR